MSLAETIIKWFIPKEYQQLRSQDENYQAYLARLQEQGKQAKLVHQKERRNKRIGDEAKAIALINQVVTEKLPNALNQGAVDFHINADRFNSDIQHSLREIINYYNLGQYPYNTGVDISPILDDIYKPYVRLEAIISDRWGGANYFYIKAILIYR